MYSDWTALLNSGWALGLESSEVISLRTLKLAQGGTAAATEFNLMISEKVDAANVLNTRAICGTLGATPFSVAAKIISHYRGEVRANRFRLSISEATPSDVRASADTDADAPSCPMPTNQLRTMVMPPRICLEPSQAELGWIAKPVGMSGAVELALLPSFQKACEWLALNHYVPESSDKTFWIRVDRTRAKPPHQDC